MDVYVRVFVACMGLIACVILILYLILIKSRNNPKLNMRDALLSSEELEEHAIKTAIEHSVTNKRNALNWPVPRMNDNYEFIFSVYKNLNEDIQKKNTIPPAAEWLLDNFYLIEEQVKGLRRDLNKKNYLRLPVLRSDLLKGYSRIFAVAVEIVSHTDGQIDEKTLSDYIKAYQSHDVLLDREIWAIPVVMRLALIENIRYLCEDIKNTQTNWHKADEIYEQWLADDGSGKNRFMKLFTDNLKMMDDANPPIIEHLFYRLRRSGRSYIEVLRAMDENLVKLGTTTELIAQKEHNSQSVNTIIMGNCITSLHYFSSMDWSELFESASFVEQILKQDPDGTYPQMDQFTRDYYRSRIEELALTYGISERYIAKEALRLAKKAYSESEDRSSADVEIQRKWHLGYYLIGQGGEILSKGLLKNNKLLPKAERVVKKMPGILYLGSVSLVTLLLVAIAVLYSIFAAENKAISIYVLAGISVLIPSSEIAVNLVNWLVCKALKPYVFPRMELKYGIPESMSTIIAIPTLLPDEKRVKELLNTLEGHYLSNREENLFFALIGAFGDSDKCVMEGDDKVIEAAMCGVRELNSRYPGEGPDKFYFFHRERKYNEKNNKWIGWERKRGALMEFNNLVMGSTDTSFSYTSCSKPPFSKVRYIITLDSDTILPMGMAKKMIGSMAHPLNRPVIDKERGVVVEGYGLMQPRIEVDIESANTSLFSQIFTGQEGIDPYANAVSDVYQDLFSEGIFTGKGIYDLQVFQSILEHAIPENVVLSHDLLEGSYVRTGLVTDLKLVDSCPTKYNAFTSRLYRWVRGDWQLLPLIFGTVINRSRNRVSNPLSFLSKWKMSDNLRRSLVAPSLMVLAALGFGILPGSVYFWLGFFILAQAFPFILDLRVYLFSFRLANFKIKRYMPVMTGLKAGALQLLLNMTFLPYHAWLMIEAILVTLTRVFITKRNLLEWVTSADAEKSQKNTLGNYLLKMKVSILIAAVLAFLIILYKPESAIIGLVFIALWLSAPFIAYWISKDQKEKVVKVSDEDMLELGRIARKTWRYFEEFTNAKGHYLAPDNFQADPPRGVAYRTSPTNIGFGLLAVLTARDLGYIGTFEMSDLIEKTVHTIEGLEKWNGHLFNWYDTNSLKPLRPNYVSTVDSGNLTGYLITLSQGLKDYLKSPVVDIRFASGIKDTLYCAGKECLVVYETTASALTAEGSELVDLTLWNRSLNELISNFRPANIKKTVWTIKFEHMIRMFKKEIEKFMPALDLLERVPQDLTENLSGDELTSGFSELLSLLKKNAKLQDLPWIYAEASGSVTGLIRLIQIAGAEEHASGLEWLQELEGTLASAIENTEKFINEYKVLIERIDAISEAMKFLPLYENKKRLFSIGFNCEENKLSNSYYDLLASEARQTSYICIARGEIPPVHWSRMGRVLTVVDRFKGLVSWTGTMFEYLMPLLIMKSYKNTLLDETYSFAIKSQKKYAKQRKMPWGTSESGFNSLGINLEYQYKAIGVPWLGLKRGLIEDAVAAPYATFLALLVDPEGAIRNIKYLKSSGLDGPYGLYEAADYTPERLTVDRRRAIVKTFMAHHQGMSLVALNNFINDNIMQKRFHSDPAMHAARLLLQEKVPGNVVISKAHKEKVVPFKDISAKEKSPVRKFYKPDPLLPKSHILSNGNYSVMITDRGTGYSKNKMMAVTRWREDSTLDQYGMFFYLRNVSTNSIWSAAYSPLNIIPDKYEVVFMADKAIFKRRDGDVETKTEVVVASGDNVEIRRISLKNHGEKACVLELTSYFEIVLASMNSDMAHPAFSNLFVETELHPEKRCIIANRRPRSEKDERVWIANTAVTDGKLIGDVQFETDRMQMISRGNNLKSRIETESGKPLSGTEGPVLDPVMSMRIKVMIEPGKTAVISFVTAASDSNELLLSMIDKYASPDSVEGAFQLALIRSQVETMFLNADVAEMELYQEMISDILFISPLRKLNQDLIMKNTKGQASLWKYGISGDLPIVLVILSKTNQVEILNEVLKAQEYWRLIDLKVDLVILSEEEYNYELPLQRLISDIILSSQTHDVLNKPGNIFILDKNNVPAEDIPLLYAVARLVLRGDGRTMHEQLKLRQGNPLPEKIKFTGKLGKYGQSEPKMPELLYFNGLGGFDPAGNDYVIRLEKGQNTPAPWVNVIANPKFGFLVSEAGSGYTWCENSRENKLTPWSNDAVSDSSGEVLYIGDRDTGQLWTVTPLPVREEEPYIIRHGFGYSVFEHTSHGIRQRLTQHVPVNESAKLSILSLKNTSEQTRNLTLTYYVRPILGVSDQITSMYIKTSLSDAGALLMENPYNEDFAGRICYIGASVNGCSVTTDRKEFFGSGDLRSPECLSREALSGAVGAGFDPCGAIQVKITLEPNESRDVVFILGMADQLQEVNNLIQKYKEPKKAKESLIEVIGFWKEKLSIVQVNTPTIPMNLMLNGWLEYQVISCRLWARSGFYQSGGAFGFRDQLQDCLAVAHVWPEIARAQILLHARHQFPEGDVQHWWHDPLGKGIRTRFSDDLLWLPYVTAEYIRITGDSKILEEELPFVEEAVLADGEDERYGKPNVSDIRTSLLDHCIRAVDISLRFGEHGLPLMGSGDWNDGMNTVGNKGFGESVWLGWFLATVLEMLVPVCIKAGDTERAAKYADARAMLSEAIEKEGWDGEWYRRAYFDNGMALGSALNTDCRIDSIAQSWAVISGAGNPQRAAKAMNSLEDYLVVREEGLIKLLTPPFDCEEMEPGYIKGYVPGIRENGGQYTHAAAWVIIAFAKLGDGDKAWELFELVNPINHTGNLREYSRYKVEPYVMAADVYSVHPHTGRGGWTWYTGSAGWMYRAGLEYILGFQKNGDTIIMDPCIPRKWQEYTIKYKYCTSTYDIRVKNPDGINKGVKKICVDGKISAGNCINLVDDGKSHDVEVVMGETKKE